MGAASLVTPMRHFGSVGQQIPAKVTMQVSDGSRCPLMTQHRMYRCNSCSSASRVSIEESIPRTTPLSHQMLGYERQGHQNSYSLGDWTHMANSGICRLVHFLQIATLQTCSRSPTADTYFFSREQPLALAAKKKRMNSVKPRGSTIG